MKLRFSFLPIPEELMRSKALSFGAKFLFGIIAKANLEEIRFSMKYLGERMDCTPREARSRAKELRENGLITSERTGRANIYTVNLELIQLIQEDSKPKKPIGTNVPIRKDSSVPIRQEHSEYLLTYSKENTKRKLCLELSNWNSNQSSPITNFKAENIVKKHGAGKVKKLMKKHGEVNGGFSLFLQALKQSA